MIRTDMRDDYLYYGYHLFMNGSFSRGVLLLFCLNLDLSLSQFGMVQSAYYLVSLIGEMPSGVIADRYSKKKVLLGGIGLHFLSALGVFLMVRYFALAFFPVLMLLFSLDALARALVSGTDQSLFFEQLKAKGNQFLA